MCFLVCSSFFFVGALTKASCTRVVGPKHPRSPPSHLRVVRLYDDVVVVRVRPRLPRPLRRQQRPCIRRKRGRQEQHRGDNGHARERRRLSVRRHDAQTPSTLTSGERCRAKATLLKPPTFASEMCCWTRKTPATRHSSKGHIVKKKPATMLYPDKQEKHLNVE